MGNVIKRKSCGGKHLDTNESGREQMSPVKQSHNNTSKILVLGSVCIIKPQGGENKQLRFLRSLHDSQKDVNSNGMLFWLFLQVTLLKVASEVILGT